MKLLPVFERLLEGWRAAGNELVSLRDYCAGMSAGDLPRHSVVDAEIEGRSGTLSVQSEEFLSEAGA
jgi:hypothetical protein